jgi:hypothetical protein
VEIKDKKLRKQIIGKFKNINRDIAKENKLKNITAVILPLSDAEIQGLLHPAQANLGYFLAWFQSLQLPSTQSESPLALIPLAPKCNASL